VLGPAGAKDPIKNKQKQDKMVNKFYFTDQNKLSKQLTDNKMKKGNRTKNDLQNTTQKTRN
jgi:hypothetical protein